MSLSLDDRHEAEGELGRFRFFQNQPVRRAGSTLWRLIGTRGGRNVQYAPVLVGAIDLARAPRPLDGVLAAA